MYEELIYPAAFLFLTIIPLLMYMGLKKIADPVPVWLPASLALATFGLLVLVKNLASFNGQATLDILLLFLLMALAVITPYSVFEKKIGVPTPALFFFLVYFIALFFSLMIFLHEGYEGRPYDHYSTILPFFYVGAALDSVIQFLNCGDAVYSFGSRIYDDIEIAGLYLEVIIVSGLSYAVFGYLFSWGRNRSSRQPPTQ